MVDRRPHVQTVDPTDHLVERPEAKLGHQLPDLLGDEPEEGRDELRRAREALAELRILGGDAHRTGVEVADAHHDAAHDNQGRGGKPELLGAEQRRDDHVAPRLELPVHLDDDAVAQLVEDEHLLGLGEAELPGDAPMLDRRER